MQRTKQRRGLHDKPMHVPSFAAVPRFAIRRQVREENCQTLDAVQLANDSLRTYCSIKGYTSVGAPTFLPGDASATDAAGAYRTVTVYEPTTVFISHATKRVEVPFVASPELPWEKNEMARFNYGPWVGSLVLLVLVPASFLLLLLYFF